MRILLAGNKQRAVNVLNSIIGRSDKYEIIGCVAHITQNNIFAAECKKLKLTLYQPENINDPKFLEKLRQQNIDIIILAGYSQIVKQDFINLAKKACINLHCGELPKYRGSSPLNWALINNEKSFTMSIIEVDTGVDKGDVLAEKTLQINSQDNIRTLTNLANKEFPKLLLKTLDEIINRPCYIAHGRRQDPKKSSYYPLRSPEDGIIMFDMHTAEEVHGRIRALTDPFPCALSFHKKTKIKFLESELTSRPYYGEPGKIYQIKKDKILVCASDKCLWIKNIKRFDNNKNYLKEIKRYDSLATIKEACTKIYQND